MTSVVPIAEAAGHPAGVSEPGANCASVQAPSGCAAAEGEIDMPAGSVTTALRSSEVAIPSGSELCGTFSATFKPAGAPACMLSGCTSSDGWNGTA